VAFSLHHQQTFTSDCSDTFSSLFPKKMLPSFSVCVISYDDYCSVFVDIVSCVRCHCETATVVSVLFLFCFCFVSVLFLYCFCIVSVLFLYCFCFVSVLFLFRSLEVQFGCTRKSPASECSALDHIVAVFY